MEKLTLEHLAPYLPYKVGCIIPLGYHRTLDVDILQVMIKENFYKCQLKLRPLSDLQKEITVNDETFVPQKVLSHLDLEWLINSKDLIMKTNYEDAIKLISWHFDVFGLIEKGLAIDINTIN